MLSQVLLTFMNTLATRIATGIRSINQLKFYFITILIFISSIAFMYKEPITLYVKSQTFATTEFRECRDITGLEKNLNDIKLKHPNMLRYSVYLYQPKQESFYKKLILTNSAIARNSPSLQSIYLSDQQTINESFLNRDYFLTDREDFDKPDLKYLQQLNASSVMFFKLSASNKLVGEINLEFDHRPTAEEVDILLKELSPLIYMYVV